VLHIVLTPSPRLADMRLADALVIFVSDVKLQSRFCVDAATYPWSDGCRSDQSLHLDILPQSYKDMPLIKTYMQALQAAGLKIDICVCDKEKCNGAVMTSSFGHVIIMVALLVNVIIGYLL